MKKHAVKSLPPQFHPTVKVDVSSDRRLLLNLNIAGLVLMVLFGWVFFQAVLWLRPEGTGAAIGVSVESLQEWALFLIVILALLAVHIVIHEAVHGLFFWIFTGARPVFAFRGAYAYAAMPGWYIRRNAFLITTLAPLVTITAAGLLLMLATDWLLPIWFVITMNASGSVGDLYVAGLLFRQPPDCLVEDQGDAVTLYRAETA